MLLAVEISLTPQTTSFLFGTLLPMVVALITVKVADARFKALTLALLSAISGVAAEVVGQDGAAVFSEDTLWSIAIAWVVAIATYYGFWKPTGAAESISQKTRWFGLGRPK